MELDEIGLIWGFSGKRMVELDYVLKGIAVLHLYEHLAASRNLIMLFKCVLPQSTFIVEALQ